MRIEKINENSIRCTLTSFDLSVRNMNLKELAYGTEKAKKLFDEMMTKASNEVGFHVENTPIMIEAIPMSSDSIQLIITKVEDPEELDTRFSKFSQNPAPKKEGEDWLSRLTNGLLEGAEGLISQLQKLDAQKGTKTAADKKTDGSDTAGAQETAQAELVEFRAFAFAELDQVLEAVKTASDFKGFSTLYRKPEEKSYVLVIESRDSQAEEFSKACNIVAEYGRMMHTVSGTLAYFDEHYKVITRDNAIQKLAQL